MGFVLFSLVSISFQLAPWSGEVSGRKEEVNSQLWIELKSNYIEMPPTYIPYIPFKGTLKRVCIGAAPSPWLDRKTAASHTSRKSKAL